MAASRTIIGEKFIVIRVCIKLEVPDAQLSVKSQRPRKRKYIKLVGDRKQ